MLGFDNTAVQEAWITTLTLQTDNQLKDNCCLSDSPVQHIAFITNKARLVLHDVLRGR